MPLSRSDSRHQHRKRTAGRPSWSLGAAMVLSMLWAIWALARALAVRSPVKSAASWQQDRTLISQTSAQLEQGQGAFVPGHTWLDTDGDPIQAHGGSVLHFEGTYYWYGENKDGPTYVPYVPGYATARVDVIGISVYSSHDLVHWQYCGLALKGGSHPDLAPQMVLERPKVLHNAATGKLVMWMHIDNANYELARAGVAVADKPEGPFHYIGSLRPSGSMARDMTLFKDDDGTAYIAYSSEDNEVMHISQLQPDYLGIKSAYNRVFIKQSREAPAMFKYRQWYLLATSGCTGWEPNRLEVFWSTDPMGQWHSLGNPCRGPSDIEAAYTFFSQDTYILPLPGHEGHYIFMADMWFPDALRESQYVWLPMWVQPSSHRGSSSSQQGHSKGRSVWESITTFQGSSTKEPEPPVQVVIQWFDSWQLRDLFNSSWPVSPASLLEARSASQQTVNEQ